MIFTITLGYAPFHMLRESIAQYYRTSTYKFHRHIYVDQHYPKDKELNRTKCTEICNEYGMEIIDPGKNLGLHHGFNYALNIIGPKSDDIVIAFDPDSFPLTQGWDSALISVLSSPDICWATLMAPRCLNDLSKYICESKTINGINATIAPRAVVNTTCAWKISFLEKIGGLRENSEYYGHLEAPMYHEMQKLGLKWAFLPDFTESEDLNLRHDPEYGQYKLVHAHLGTYKKDFESWLHDGKPGLDKISEIRWE